MAGWNFADVFEQIAEVIPEATAQRQGDRTSTWSQFDRRADGIGRALLDAGLVEQDKVVQYLHNGPEYLESVFGAFKAGLATVNTNYRYTEDELVYLWDNADAAAVVFHGTFSERVDAIRSRVPRVRLWLHVDDGTGAAPDWAVPYTPVAESVPGRTIAPWGRNGDHLLLLYTGGTTGMPKGVMWRQDDVIGALEANNRRRLPAEPDSTSAAARLRGPGPRGLPGAPLMHGTGFFNAMSTLLMGGSITSLVGRSFDPVELLDTIDREGINSISIVGDAFARPILSALDEHPDRWDISSLRVIVSSGVMWSQTTKEGLLRHNPRLILLDTLGSSEAIGMATNTTTSESSSETATFTLGSGTRVVTDDGRDVVPGSGERGRVALRGHMPLGYYKDEEKSAATFQMIDGTRYSIPGDWAEVDADGTVRLLGRGSQCINTGGEKVYPEEVEEALKTHPSVRDAAVVALPDERFGQTVCALVETEDGSPPDPDALIDHVRDRLARYKAPRTVLGVETVGRAVNGKLDYRRLGEVARERVGLEGEP
ncbi:MAG: acyl-CoA synthetase [Ilumatobacteraceae bacterium]|nr:acyl-CoA synthetase [Actinomycetota bacterium]